MATSNISLVNTLNLVQRKELLNYALDCADRGGSSLSDFRALLRYRDRAYQRTLLTAQTAAAAHYLIFVPCCATVIAHISGSSTLQQSTFVLCVQTCLAMLANCKT